MHLVKQVHDHPLDALATAANIDARKQLHTLLNRPKGWKFAGSVLVANRRYTFKHLRKLLLRRSIYLAIRQSAKPQVGKTPESSNRWKIERTFSILNADTKDSVIGGRKHSWPGGPSSRSR